MNQCLRCKKPCETKAIFCDDCQLHLRDRLEQKDHPAQTLLLQEVAGTVEGGSRRAGAVSIPSMPLASLQDGTANEQDEHGVLSQTTTPPTGAVLNRPPAEVDNADQEERDPWQDRSDPLLARHLPSSAESALIEEADMQRALAQDESETSDAQQTRLVSRYKTLRRPVLRLWALPGRVRFAFLLLTVVAAIALIGDSMLIFLDLTHHPSTVRATNAIPMLTLAPSTVHTGQIVVVHINEFSPAARVLLTHDIQETVRTDTGSAFIKLGAHGEGDVRILVEDSWGPGFHMIEAEDAATHYTASATLQVINDLPLRPPHLLVTLPGDSSGLHGPLNMGTDLQGANTIQPLTLRNTGGSWISWMASSNAPWLLLSPAQGIFREGQSIFVAVTRAQLKPGDYSAAISILSNTGMPVVVQVKMSVLPLPVSDTGVMVVMPPVLAFSAADGATDPASQQLTISNPGTQPLNWSLTSSVPEGFYNNTPYTQDDLSWLSIGATSGTLAAGGTDRIRVIVRSHNLLPSVYSALLTFYSAGNALNAPQAVGISLTVQSRCGVATSLGSVSFTTFAGQNTPDSQVLDLSTTAGCTGAIIWQSFPSVSWLSVKPGGGQLQVNANTIASVTVNTGALQPGTYSGNIVFLTDLRSQTLMVQLTVFSPSSTMGEQRQGSASPVPRSGTPAPGPSSTPGPGTPFPTPGPGTPTPTPGPGTPTPSPVPGTPTPTPTPTPPPAPILQVGPLDLQFTVTQGQKNPASQSIKMSNSGGSTLYWQGSVNASSSSWLSLSPLGGSVAAGQSLQVAVSVNASSLGPGSYDAQITLTATNGSGTQVQGSPQTVAVTLTVLEPCTLQETPGSLSFTATLLQPQPPGQNITFHETGNCARPVSWMASVNTGSRSWLQLSAHSGSDHGGGSTIVVDVNAQGKLLGDYTGQITLTALDGNGAGVQNSPQLISVTLLVIA